MSLFDLPVEKHVGKNNEWYTPACYVEAAREVMGSIDLDPASSATANLIVRATKYHTVEDNGLAHEWHGRVWLNPPFAQPERASKGLFRSSIEAFSQKLISEYQAGRVTQAILLTMPRTDVKWFQPLWGYPFCFTDHAIKFYGEKINPKNSLKHMYGTVFVYFGKYEQKFIDAFSEFGPVIPGDTAIRRQITKPTNLELWSA